MSLGMDRATITNAITQKIILKLRTVSRNIGDPKNQ